MMYYTCINLCIILHVCIKTLWYVNCIEAHDFHHMGHRTIMTN